MPISTCKLIPGYYYHLYNRAVAGSLLFVEKRNYEFFLSKIKKYLVKKSEILAYCLMPNHYHLLVKILDDGFSRSMQKLALSYAVSFNNLYQRKGHLFQGGFRRIHVNDPIYLYNLSLYIHLNPLKANIISRMTEWKFSSLRQYIGDEPVDFINPSIILDLVSGEISCTQAEKKHGYLQSLLSFQERNWI
jgi:REP element-mobilizing transposase RayT